MKTTQVIKEEPLLQVEVVDLLFSAFIPPLLAKLPDVKKYCDHPKGGPTLSRLAALNLDAMV